LITSPAELLLGQAIEDNLPRKIPRDALKEVVAPRLEERQELQKVYHDRSTRQLPELTPRQRQSIQDQSTLKWKPAKVREKFAGVSNWKRAEVHYNPYTAGPSEQHRSQSRHR